MIDAEDISAEEQVEREVDRIYGQPLKAELERLRHSMRSDSETDAEAQ